MEIRYSCAASPKRKVCADGDGQIDRADGVDDNGQFEPAEGVKDGGNWDQIVDLQLEPSDKELKNLRLLSALAHSIRKRRQSRRITQDELAHATGLDRSYIVSIEKGKRNISIGKLVQIAAELGLSASQLLRIAEDQLED